MPAPFSIDTSARELRFDDELIRGVVISRPNRYVAQVQLSEGKAIRAHVPVGGRIGGLTLDGLPCLLSGPYPNRATDYSVEAIGSHYSTDDPDFQWIGINQTASNRYVGELLKADLLPELAGNLPISSLRSERRLGEKRIDFSLGKNSDPVDLWIEVKTPLISLAASLDPTIPLKTDFGKAAPSTRMPEQFEELAKSQAKGGRVVFLGVFGYSLYGSDAETRFRDNLNLDGLVERGLELGMEFWELELSLNSERIKLASYEKLFGSSLRS